MDADENLNPLGSRSTSLTVSRSTSPVLVRSILKSIRVPRLPNSGVGVTETSIAGTQAVIFLLSSPVTLNPLDVPVAVILFCNKPDCVPSIVAATWIDLVTFGARGSVKTSFHVTEVVLLLLALFLVGSMDADEYFNPFGSRSASLTASRYVSPVLVISILKSINVSRFPDSGVGNAETWIADLQAVIFFSSSAIIL
ncbi:Uncharacterised protein [uncultured archaeon]|nr:Uncharacterised protein [uncultured archaeon]